MPETLPFPFPPNAAPFATDTVPLFPLTLLLAAVIALVALPLLWLVAVPCYHSYLRGGWFKAMGLACLALVGSLTLVAHHLLHRVPLGRLLNLEIAQQFDQFERLHEQRLPEVFDQVPLFIAPLLLPWFALPLVAQLLRGLSGKNLAAEEKSPDLAGLRAWLRAGNLICAVAVALCLAWGYGYSFWAALAMILALLLVYPVINMLVPLVQASLKESPAAAPANLPGSDLFDERQRVLRLLEDGKITAEESAELFSALGQTTRIEAPPAVTPISAGRKFLLVGAVLGLVGFLLPWASVVDHRYSHYSSMDPPVLLPDQRTIFSGAAYDGSVWFMLLLGVGAALLPYIAPSLRQVWQRRLTYGPLAIIALMLLWHLSFMDGQVQIGYFVFAFGHVLQWIGAVREYRLVAAAPVRPMPVT